MKCFIKIETSIVVDHTLVILLGYVSKLRYGNISIRIRDIEKVVVLLVVGEIMLD